MLKFWYDWWLLTGFPYQRESARFNLLVNITIYGRNTSAIFSGIRLWKPTGNKMRHLEIADENNIHRWKCSGNASELVGLGECKLSVWQRMWAWCFEGPVFRDHSEVGSMMSAAVGPISICYTETIYLTSKLLSTLTLLEKLIAVMPCSNWSILHERPV